jgi:hypothetical protein
MGRKPSRQAALAIDDHAANVRLLRHDKARTTRAAGEDLTRPKIERRRGFSDATRTGEYDEPRVLIDGHALVGARAKPVPIVPPRRERARPELGEALVEIRPRRPWESPNAVEQREGPRHCPPVKMAAPACIS